MLVNKQASLLDSNALRPAGDAACKRRGVHRVWSPSHSPGALWRRELGSGGLWAGTGQDLEPQGRGGALPFPGCAAWGEFLALSGPKGPISDKRKEEACSDFHPDGGPQTLCSCVRRYYQHLGEITAGCHFCLNKKNHLILG